MIKAVLVEELAARFMMPKREAAIVVQAIFDTMATGAGPGRQDRSFAASVASMSACGAPGWGTTRKPERASTSPPGVSCTSAPGESCDTYWLGDPQPLGNRLLGPLAQILSLTRLRRGSVGTPTWPR